MMQPPPKPALTPDGKPAPDAEGPRRVAVMNGDFGEEAQHAAVLQRSLELIDHAFDLYSFCPASGAAVNGSRGPFLHVP